MRSSRNQNSKKLLKLSFTALIGGALGGIILFDSIEAGAKPPLAFASVQDRIVEEPFSLPRVEKTLKPAKRIESTPVLPTKKKKLKEDTLLSKKEKTKEGKVSFFFPVKNVDKSILKNSFWDPRSGGRTHKAIDVYAPKGTPIFAMLDGVIKQKRWDKLGGRHLYLVSEKGYTFFYAHLDGYKKGLEVGQTVKRGDLIAYVGNTGNAKGGRHHLHLGIYKLKNIAKWWSRAKPVNPYPLLMQAETEIKKEKSPETN